MRGNAITSTFKKPMEKSKKESMNKERKLLKSHLTTLLIGWTLTLSPIVL